MQNMVKYLLAVVFVFTANSSFAESKDQTQNFTVKAGPCVHLHSPYRCNNYPTGECFWDEADQRCENRNNTEDRCSLLNCPSSCLSSAFGCFWDYDDQRCERR